MPSRANCGAPSRAPRSSQATHQSKHSIIQSIRPWGIHPGNSMSKQNTDRGVSLGAERRGSRGAAEGRSEDLLRRRGYQLADSSLQRQVVLSALSLWSRPGCAMDSTRPPAPADRGRDTHTKCRHRLNINLNSETYHCCQRGQVVDKLLERGTGAGAGGRRKPGAPESRSQSACRINT